MRKVFLISIMLTAMCVIAFWQPSTEELVSSEIMDYEGIEPSETTIYTDSLIKGLYETFGSMIQIEKKKGTILLSYNPHLPQFHRTPLNDKEFMNIHSDQDCQNEETGEDVTIHLYTQADSLVLVPNDLLNFIIDRHNTILR